MQICSEDTQKPKRERGFCESLLPYGIRLRFITQTPWERENLSGAFEHLNERLGMKLPTSLWINMRQNPVFCHCLFFQTATERDEVLSTVRDVYNEWLTEERTRVEEDAARGRRRDPVDALAS